MPETARGKNRRSALEQAGVESRTFKKPSILIEEVPGTSIVRLHSLLEQPFQAQSPFNLPTETGACNGSEPAILCLRPGEWLLVSETLAAQKILRQLADSIDPGRTAALDTSDGLSLFRLSGPGAAWLLSKLSGLDFFAGQTHGSHCARTKMGHVAVIVHYHPSHGGHPVFDLVVDRSLAKYLWFLLIESADHAEELSMNHGDTA